ncbi:uncharacterized protein LOC143021501 [Oratosquilla oratoria]|uniref:uncharacterized protein LOC143021501 n=1 Tax=Oratosquilla oratoria TaxID=337810 RepID=UPI003F758D9A
MEVNIERLPNEILLKIFKYLPHEDLIWIGTVCRRFDDLSSDKSVIENVNLDKSQQYIEKDFICFFSKKIRCLNIRRISLNNIYWVRLPSLVVKLNNLETLHLVGTTLTFLQFKWILTSCPKLKKLSISWPEDMQTYNKKLWSGGLNEVSEVLSHLTYIQVLVHTDPFPLLVLLNFCQGLEDIIITNHHARASLNTPGILNITKAVPELPNLKRLIMDLADGDFRVQLATHVAQFILDGCKKSSEWKTFWINGHHQIIISTPAVNMLQTCKRLLVNLTPDMVSTLQKVESLDSLETLMVKGQSPHIVNLTSLVRSCPNLKNFHVLDGLNLSFDMRKICDSLPNLEKLSICCQPSSSPLRVSESIAKLRKLTHLSVPTCVLIDTVNSNQPTQSQNDGGYPNFTHGFKRQRVGVTHVFKVHDAAFNSVLENCPQLQLLEIGFTTRISCSPARVNWECLENIKKLHNLTHLTLDSLSITNGNFFILIAESCVKLCHLRIKDLGSSAKCCYKAHLIKAIPAFKQLQKFRLEQHHLAPAADLFQALKSCSKLEQLFIHSERDSMALDTDALCSLIDQHTSLLFVFVVGAGTTKAKCTIVTRKYKKTKRPALIVRLRNVLWDVFDPKNVDNRNIPACYYNEMITYRSWAYDYWKEEYSATENPP